jgi:hypothetical protein
MKRIIVVLSEKYSTGFRKYDKFSKRRWEKSADEFK